MSKKQKRVSDVAQVENPDLVLLAVVLNDALKRSGLTIAEVARQLGVNRRQVTNLLDAKGDPTLKFVAQVADVLNCRVRPSFAERDKVEHRPGPSARRRSRLQHRTS
jgi:transcriptional regulator with XRE-family HTH domain